MSKFYDGNYTVAKEIEIGHRTYPVENTREIYEYEKAYQIMSSSHIPWDGTQIIYDGDCIMTDESVISNDNGLTIFRRRFGKYPAKVFANYSLDTVSYEGSIPTVTTPSTSGTSGTSTTPSTTTGTGSLTSISTGGGNSIVGGSIESRTNGLQGSGSPVYTAIDITGDFMPLIYARTDSDYNPLILESGVLRLDINGTTGYTIGYATDKTDYSVDFANLGGQATNFTNHYLEIQNGALINPNPQFWDGKIICNYEIPSLERLSIDFDTSGLNGSLSTQVNLLETENTFVDGRAETTQRDTPMAFYIPVPTNTDTTSFINVSQKGFDNTIINQRVYYDATIESMFPQADIDYYNRLAQTPSKTKRFTYNTSLTKETILASLCKPSYLVLVFQKYKGGTLNTDIYSHLWIQRFFPYKFPEYNYKVMWQGSDFIWDVEEVTIDAVDYWRFYLKDLSVLKLPLDTYASAYYNDFDKFKGPINATNVFSESGEILSTTVLSRKEDTADSFGIFRMSSLSDSVGGLSCMPYIQIFIAGEDEYIVDAYDSPTGFDYTTTAINAKTQYRYSLVNPTIKNSLKAPDEVITAANMRNYRTSMEAMVINLNNTGLLFNKKLSDFAVGDKVEAYYIPYKTSSKNASKMFTGTVAYIDLTKRLIAFKDNEGEYVDRQRFAPYTIIRKLS